MNEISSENFDTLDLHNYSSYINVKYFNEKRTDKKSSYSKTTRLPIISKIDNVKDTDSKKSMHEKNFEDNYSISIDEEYSDANSEIIYNKNYPFLWSSQNVTSFVDSDSTITCGTQKYFANYYYKTEVPMQIDKDQSNSSSYHRKKHTCSKVILDNVLQNGILPKEMLPNSNYSEINKVSSKNEINSELCSRKRNVVRR